MNRVQKMLIAGIAIGFILAIELVLTLAFVMRAKEPLPVPRAEPKQRSAQERVIEEQATREFKRPYLLKIDYALATLTNTALAGTGPRALPRPFPVYADSPYYFKELYEPSGWMGDWKALNVDKKWTDRPYKGSNCMRWSYATKQEGNKGWAGVYWQYPTNNWGDIDGGFDLTGAEKITFSVRGEQGGEILAFKSGGIAGKNRDTYTSPTHTIKLTTEWEHHEFDLTGRDLSRVNGIMSWTAVANRQPYDLMTFYIDEVWIK